jgi:ubiquinone/menaquinone biosynthesis C-methylase UbiE
VRTLLLLVLATASLLAEQGRPPAPREEHGRLFPPKDLGLLEAPDRDLWQHPDRVMDTLGIAEAAVVADIGAGSGWFTIRLARRVGPNGVVWAEDVQPEMLQAISRRVQSEGLQNVRTRRGEDSDPNLPAATFDAVIMVDAYHENEKDVRVPLLKNLAKVLKPEGRIGVIDFRLEGSGPGPPNEERVAPEVVIKDAIQAGLRLLSEETFLPYQYFLIFGLEPSALATRARARPKPPAARR